MHFYKKGSTSIFSLEMNHHLANQRSHLFSMLIYIFHGGFPLMPDGEEACFGLGFFLGNA